MLFMRSIATVYAHLSKFTAEADVYVDRAISSVIPAVSRRPRGWVHRAPSAFEVRQNGIPVDPENFLPELEE